MTLNLIILSKKIRTTIFQHYNLNNRMSASNNYFFINSPIIKNIKVFLIR